MLINHINVHSVSAVLFRLAIQALPKLEKEQLLLAFKWDISHRVDKKGDPLTFLCELLSIKVVQDLEKQPGPINVHSDQLDSLVKKQFSFVLSKVSSQYLARTKSAVISDHEQISSVESPKKLAAKSDERAVINEPPTLLPAAEKKMPHVTALPQPETATHRPCCAIS